VSILSTLTSARDLVADAGVDCQLDPRALTRLPAVWIRLDGLSAPTLEKAYSVALVTVFCIVPPLDPERDLGALEPLLATVAAIIPPMTDPTLVALGLPGGGTPAPAFSYTHDLTIDD
jgi:hypothetical protein